MAPKAVTADYEQVSFHREELPDEFQYHEGGPPPAKLFWFGWTISEEWLVKRINKVGPNLVKFNPQIREDEIDDDDEDDEDDKDDGDDEDDEDDDDDDDGGGDNDGDGDNDGEEGEEVMGAKKELTREGGDEEVLNLTIKQMQAKDQGVAEKEETKAMVIIEGQKSGRPDPEVSLWRTLSELTFRLFSPEARMRLEMPTRLKAIVHRDDRMRVAFVLGSNRVPPSLIPNVNNIGEIQQIMEFEEDPQWFLDYETGLA